MSTPDPRMTSYLLGELSEPDATVLEREFFGNPDVFARLVEAETTLVDDYVRRRLLPQTMARFEQHYLADPRRRARAEFADTLATKIDRTEDPWQVRPTSPHANSQDVQSASGIRWAWSLSAAAALAILAVSTGWLWLQSNRLRGELSRSEIARSREEQRTRDLQGQLSGAQASAREMTGELERLKARSDDLPTPTTPAPSFVTLLLTVPSSRTPATAEASTLTIPAGTREVRIGLSIDDVEYGRYQVALNPVGGAVAFESGRLAPRKAGDHARIDVAVPAARLTAGDYMLTLTGTTSGAAPETVSQLLFRVVSSPNRR